jgi:membrane fusion protein (multidrug efflux system)
VEQIGMTANAQTPELEDGSALETTPGTSRGTSPQAKEKEEEDERHPGKKDNREDQQNKQPDGPPVYKRPAVVISASLVLLLALIAGLLYYLHSRHYTSTDDAFVDGHVTLVSPQVPALVLVLHITDNQLVHQGDLLVELDPTNYQVALEQARAQLFAAQGKVAQARAQVGASQAALEESAAEVRSATVSLENATRDLKRYENVDERARSEQQLDRTLTAQRNAQAQLDEARAKKASAEANVATAEAAVKSAEGDERTAEANVHRAEVDLSYCKIYAPGAGRITQRTVEPGAYLQTGQAMFSLVAPEVWVTANFKETQLNYMRPGQPVTIKVDAFPDRKFQGHVDSIQAGSGSRFSVLPAENATGNFVKVVQRVPVKIVFEHGPNLADYHLLGPGMSVIPKVKVR